MSRRKRHKRNRQSQPQPAVAPPEQRRRVPWRALGVSLLAVVLVVAAGWVVIRIAMGNRLTRAIAEADRLDPGWRMTDLTAARARNIPLPEQNSAMAVVHIVEQLPKDWPADRSPAGQAKSKIEANPKPEGDPRGVDLFRALVRLEPEESLDPALRRGLHSELAPFGPVLERARALAGASEGRYPVHMVGGPANPSAEHSQAPREVARLLQLDVVARSDAGDADGALESSRAILGAARSIGDEPMALSQLTRMAIESGAVASIVRVLAHGEPSVAALERLDRDLADEFNRPLLVDALRGERANAFGMTDLMARGRLAPQVRSGASNWAALTSPYFRYNQALVLEFLNPAVEIAKRPPHEQAARWAQWKKTTSRPTSRFNLAAGAPVYLLAPAMGAMADAYLRSRAIINCARTMVLLERYRREHGHWPADVGKDLPDRPLDPYDGMPIRVARRERGFTVYSVGPDGNDNGGNLDPKFQREPGTDYGYVLWDPDQRSAGGRKELPAGVFQSDSGKPR